MRPSSQRGVAPLNTNPKWPEGYIAIAREAGAVEKTIPFLVTWVRRFLAWFPGRSRRGLGRAEIETFLGKMALRNEISNWQIGQAREALELYYEQFRGIPLEPRPDHVRSTTTPSASSRPSREHDTPLAANDPSVHKPTTEGLAPYQVPASAVKGAVRERESLRPSSSMAGRGVPLAPPVPPQGVPAPGPASGKTNWRLLEARVREYLRVAHYAYRTEQTYLGWIRPKRGQSFILA